MSSVKRRQALVEASPDKLNCVAKKARKSITPSKSKELFDQENLDCMFDEADDSYFACCYGTNSPIQALDKCQFNLESWQRCIVERIIRDKENFHLILTLVNENNSDEKVECCLQGFWANTKLDVGDLVSIKALWDGSLKCFVVTNTDGVIVTNPDCLLSGTSVLGSLFCARRGILQEKFLGIDSGNKLMAIGSFAHELFQFVLNQKLRTAVQIERACDEVLRSEDAIFTLYSNKISVEEMKIALTPFVSKIVDFVDQYIVGTSNGKGPDDAFRGVIDTIQDIEENVWVPRLGLKGKIDVSLRVKPHIDSENTESKYMPLELKTGRASFSHEHRGQLMIYVAMLNEIGHKVDSGLLLYLREGIMKEVNSTYNSFSGIIMLRNEMSYYLTREVHPNDSECLNEKTTRSYQYAMLPEPINHYNACSKCPYNTICTLFQSKDEPNGLSNHETLRKVADECMAHLESADVEYFTHWCGILSLEDQELKRGSYPSNWWTRKPEQRRDDGCAIINLKIDGHVLAVGKQYLHSFEAFSADDVLSANFHDFTMLGFSLGEYVIISIRKRVAIAAGHIHEITKSQISVHLERNLLENFPNEHFIIDKSMSQSSNKFNFTNLGVLLENRPETNNLRRIIVDKRRSVFSTDKCITLPKVAQEIISDLNADQLRAVKMALKMKDYILLKGLPGTGKTQSLIAIIRLFYLLGKSILVTSHTHSAVDNVLKRLRPHKVKFLRLGSNSRIDSSLHDCSETQLTSSCKTPSDLAKLYTSYNVIGVTCQGATHPIFHHRKFDVCIVDEATQVFQPTILRPLFYAEKFILVGDPDQLPPVVKSKLARKIGASESLFERLDFLETTALLSSQYRMNKTVTRLANLLTYKGNLKCGNETIMNRTIDLPKRSEIFKEFKKDIWLMRATEKHVDLSVMLLDTKYCLERSHEFEISQSAAGLTGIVEKIFSDEVDNVKKVKFACTNYCDAAIAFYIVKCLIIGGMPGKNIGIIAPYRAQVELLRKIHEEFKHFYAADNALAIQRIDFEGVEVNTVDQYQGRDKDVIIYACTRTADPATMSKKSANRHGSEILEDQRRLTVAITRSKCKLILIADEECLQMYTPFKMLFEIIPSRCKIRLEDGALGFSWENVFNELKSVLAA